MSTVPLIDLSNPHEDSIVSQIATACENPGFFQVQNHGIPPTLISQIRQQCEQYIALDRDVKLACKRSADNARGYFDDELTKQKRDWKECLDVGMPGSRRWDVPDDAFENACLDGYNRFPPLVKLPLFRATIIEWFEVCASLADRLAMLMARGLGESDAAPFVQQLKENHSSFLRTNFYAPCPIEESHTGSDDRPMGISPHRDSGFLTVLLQDDDCHSLQVIDSNGDWQTVTPIPGALTINIGDMAQVWSNGRYHAPLHRVLTNTVKPRSSLPFFYNPGYTSLVEPSLNPGESPQYHPVCWGYYRAVRFAGDVTDFGTEIQVDDFEVEKDSPHLRRQNHFIATGMAHHPFDVVSYGKLLAESTAG